VPTRSAGFPVERGRPWPLAASAALGAALLAAPGCQFRTDAPAGPSGDPAPPDAAEPVDAVSADGPEPDAPVSATAEVGCTASATPPDPDGRRDEEAWQAAEFIAFDVNDAELVADLQTSYGFDARLSFACLHDGDDLFFFVSVEDDLLVDNSVISRQDDGVVLFLDGDGDRGGAYSANDHALFLSSQNSYFDYGPGDLDPVGTTVRTEAGYDIEVRLPAGEIGAVAASGLLGFNLALIDDDGLGSTDRDIFALRHVPAPPACPDCCQPEEEPAPFCDTQVSGTLTLEP
jgi:hypothetical protein